MLLRSVLAVATLSLMGCNVGSDDDSSGSVADGDCSTSAQNEYVYQQLKTNYLWPETIPSNINSASYSSPETLLNALRYRTYDKYSYITTEAKYNAQSNNEFKAIGIYFKWLVEDGEDVLIVRYTDENSPARLAGVVRGDEIIEIDGMTISEYIKKIEELNYDSWEKVRQGFGNPNDYVFKMRRTDNSEYTVSLIPVTYSTNTVHDLKFFDTSANKVAYFSYKNFSSASRDEFKSAFSQIRANQADALILDLRMNPGGSILTANHLATRIAGAQVSSQTFANFMFSAQRSNENFVYPFKNDEVSDAVANLNTLYVLTSSSTCSASELIINSLKPFIDVKVVGGKTCGKPIGMTGHSFCGNILFPIEFQLTNARNEGGYFSGISPSCEVEDDYAHRFGDENDPLLATALRLSAGESCPTPKPFNRLNRQAATDQSFMIQGEPSQFKENFF
ncbi:S41 family peptidase [Marinomonas mediterranea]|uniref:Peptidase S41 n=1 Tax=Marinomonas mediterranea (strain ATCC 700492 / JCM 21426 / NBRC 103028 / MMB-1) TaxID=717774 RepID=F2JXP0_MARM1|nr:S41 family peptidase [Marinomonas mediterranea]ADZ93038.1 peptidase S41 [Marinomonas mediterranea MMB-1]WCN10947.1 hypothetical protein GV055_19435 [Marinomonas mediterranea]WCN19053.1 hypothetical protein GV053_19400 [Marinomonas mediterranea MMB-1]